MIISYVIMCHTFFIQHLDQINDTKVCQEFKGKNKKFKYNSLDISTVVYLYTTSDVSKARPKTANISALFGKEKNNIIPNNMLSAIVANVL